MATVDRIYGHDHPYYDDLVAVGCADGLNTAIEKFDYTRGIKFSTYATWWIYESTALYIKKEGVIYKPPHIQEQLKDLKSAQYKLMVERRKPTDDALAKEIARAKLTTKRKKPTEDQVDRAKRPTKDVRELRVLAMPIVSLQTAFNPEGRSDIMLQDIIADEDVDTEAAALEQIELATLHDLIDSLPDNRQRLAARFYLASPGEMVNSRLAEHLGVVNATAKRIWERCLANLRELARLRNFNPYETSDQEDT